MLNETNASLAGTAVPINLTLIAIIISIFTLVVMIIALYPPFAKERREKKNEQQNVIKEKRTARIAHINNLIDNFYGPLEEALKDTNPDIFKFGIRELQQTPYASQYPHLLTNYITNFGGKFMEKYELCREFSHFAPNKIVNYLNNFKNNLIAMLPGLLFTPVDEEITVPDYYQTSYNALKLETETNLKLLKKELVELMNL